MPKLRTLVVSEKLHSRLKSESLKRGMKIQTLTESLIEKGLQSEIFFAPKVNNQLINRKQD